MFVLNCREPVGCLRPIEMSYTYHKIELAAKDTHAGTKYMPGRPHAPIESQTAHAHGFAGRRAFQTGRVFRPALLSSMSLYRTV